MVTSLRQRASRLTETQFVFGLFVLALVIQLVFAFVLFAVLDETLNMAIDPDQYGVLARNWANGDGYTFLPGDVPTTYRGPGYTVVLAVVYAVFGEGGMQPVVAVLQSVCGALTAVVIFYLGRRAFRPAVGVLAGLLGAVHPLLIWYAPRYRYEPLFTLLFMLALLFTLHVWQERRLRDGLLAGLFFGLASLVSQTALLAPVGLFVLMLLLPGRRVQLIGPLALAGAVTVLVVAPWTIRNYDLTGQFIPVQEGGMTQFYKGNIEYARYEEAPLQSVVLAELAAQDMADVLGVEYATFDLRTPGLDATFSPLVMDYLRTQPGHFIGKVITQAVRFWYLSETAFKSYMLLAIQAIYLIPAAVGLVVGLRRRESRVPVVLMLATIGYVMLLYAATHVEARYSTPILPLVVVLAGAGVLAVADFLRRGRRAGITVR
ncbi:MAG: glycosyltransferase family 39 protein [Anaerolineae bacterium]|nr:glycosyltransferase family 39 protein [Anaerolineae bacterium]